MREREAHPSMCLEWNGGGIGFSLNNSQTTYKDDDYFQNVLIARLTAEKKKKKTKNKRDIENEGGGGSDRAEYARAQRGSVLIIGIIGQEEDIKKSVFPMFCRYKGCC